MTLQELAKDTEFCERFPYVWSKLEKLLLQKQRDFAAKHRGEYELIGRYVDFLSELMGELKTLEATVHLETGKPKRPKLHNEQFKS